MELCKRLVARRIISMFLLAAFLLIGAMSAEAAEKVSGADIGNAITEEERERFIRGAEKVGGLDGEQIKRVLENPELIDTVPVDVAATTRTLDAPSSAHRMRASGAECKRKIFTLEYDDKDGRPLLRFTATKLWCINGAIVTSSNMRNVETWVRPDSRYTRSAGGWRYDATSEYGTEKYVAFKGYVRGSHLSTRAGRFEYAFPGEAKAKIGVWPAVRQRGFGNGACHSVQYEAVQPTVHAKPPLRTNKTTAALTFSSRYRGSAFQCSLDGSPFTDCRSPKTYAGLRDGVHSFRIQARNGAGHALARPAAYRWTVEATAPRIVGVSPQAGATGVAATANVAAKFSKEVDALTLIGNFTLAKSASKETVRASLRYDPGSGMAILDPNTNLTPGTAYTATIKAGNNGVKDKAGNALAKGRVWSFTTAG